MSVETGTTICALAFTAPHVFSLVTKPRPVPGPNETLVAPSFVGICATDIELLEATHPYFQHGLAVHPLQPGHEWSGTVIESPDPRFPPGSRVVGDPEVPCGRADCPFCGAGHTPWCPDRQETGCRGGLDGAAATAITIPTVALRAIPDGVSARDAVLAEPATTVLGGLFRVGDVRGRRALVIGAGTIGIIAAQVFQHAGAAVDLAVRRVSKARAIPGVTTVEVSGQGDAAVASRYEVVICAAGTPEAFGLSIAAVANGGVVALLGVPGERVDDVDVASILHKDATLHGVLNYSGAGPGTIDRALALIAEGVIDPGPIIDSSYPLDRAGEAFTRAGDAGRDRPKVLVDVAATTKGGRCA
jgi:threonine dehydrogenase-like Zn-dependent dehydrogenase